MIFKKWKKYHFNVFQNEKHFEKLPQLHLIITSLNPLGKN